MKILKDSVKNTVINMGNRCIIVVHNKKEFGPVIYQHWAVDPVDTIKEFKELMQDRKGDVSYCSARLIGILHVRTHGILSLGVWNLPKEFEQAIKDRLSGKDNNSINNYTHHDEGIYLIDCDDFSYIHVG